MIMQEFVHRLHNFFAEIRASIAHIVLQKRDFPHPEPP